MADPSTSESPAEATQAASEQPLSNPDDIPFKDPEQAEIELRIS